MVSGYILGRSLIIFVMALLPVDAVIHPSKDLHIHACEGTTLNIRCANNERINIIHANYGRQSKSLCNSNGQAPIHSTNCVSENSLRIVKAECSNKRECSVRATNGVFGDPCEGTFKYLLVGYQCTEKRRSTRVVACEGTNLDIACERGEQIEVVRANYGRSSNKICDQNGNAPILTTNCVSLSSKTIVDEKCSGERQCSVSASNDVFGDPCRNTFKYLEVDFICVKRFIRDN